jgi:hypothetical protein
MRAWADVLVAERDEGGRTYESVVGRRSVPTWQETSGVHWAAAGPMVAKEPVVWRRRLLK